MKQLLITFFVLFISLQLSFGNKTFLKEISLKQMVDDSGIILLVRINKPFINQEKIEIYGFNKREPFKPIPAFETLSYNFEVIRVLKDSRDSNLAGKKINVYPAYSEQKLDLHKKYYIENISKSPIYNEYNSTIANENQMEKETEIIIFIIKTNWEIRNEYKYELSAENGYEQINFLSEIEGLIKDK